MSENLESSKIRDTSNNDIPSILTNGDLLQPHFIKKAGKTTKFYAINDSLFEEDEECEANSDIKEFEVYLQKVDKNFFRMENEDEYSMPAESDVSKLEDDIPDKEFEISIQNVPHGIIINSNVYLTNHQWHTMIFIDIKLLKCVACQMFCDLDSCQGHMESPFHVRNLANYKPLEKFELSVTRRIRNDYHCGVCNESFNITDDNDHYASKTHEGNLLFAINKVSDLMYDYNMQETSNSRTDTHNSRTDTHNSRTDTHNSRTDTHNSRTDTHSPGSYETRQNNYNDWYHVDAHVSNNYDSCSSTSYDYEEEYNEPIKGTSYASMASKPKTVELPKFLNINLGAKSFKVRFESWHMIIKTKLNEFYCMVCNKHQHIKFKAEHCMDEEHVGRLAGCKIVEKYDDYLIRIVNDKLYHCGHCNNLQVKPDMAAHIELVHPKKNKNIIEDVNHKNCQSIIKNKDGGAQKLKTTVGNGKHLKHNNTGEVNRCSNRNSDCDQAFGQSNGSNRAVNNEELAKNIVNTNNIVLNTPDIHSSIVIYPFGYKLNILLLSYNFVYVRSGGCYCRICDFLCNEEEVNRHIYSLQHIELIQRTPFILQFSSNLIRAVRYSLHCAICNIVVEADKIYEHNMVQAHTTLLAKALGIVLKGVRQPLNEASESQKAPSGAQNVIQPPIRIPPTRPQVPLSGAQNVFQAPIRVPVTRPQLPPFVSQMNTAPQIYPQHFRPRLSQTMSNETRTEEKSTDKPILPKSNTTPGPVRTPSIIQSTRPNSKTQSDTKTQNIKAPNIAPERGLKTNKTNLKSNEPDMETNRPDSEGNKPVLETNEPDLEANKPHLESVEPQLAPNEPDLETDQSELETIEPDAEANEDIDESFDSTEEIFDTEQYVYIKLKNIYSRITNSAYNTLVPVGDSGRYCFVCATRVDRYDLKKHADSRAHVENIEKYKFLDKYKQHLFRQIYLTYHCSTCNVLVRRRDLKCHIEWPTHVSLQGTMNRDAKKLRKNELKSGIMVYNVTTTKEVIYLHEKEAAIKINFNYAVIKDTHKSTDSVSQTSSKDKMVIFKNNVLKFSHYAWNSVIKLEGGFYKCAICQKQLKHNELDGHLKSSYHTSSLNKPFEKQYYPALIRQINDTCLHCLICNNEIPNREHIIDDHINGRKHGKCYEMVLKYSSETSTYADCDDDILNV